MSMEIKTTLEDIKLPIRIKLSSIWISVMFCYIYADYFGLYKPGTLQEMLDGKMGPLGPTTQGVLLGTSLMMAIPSLMIFLTLALPASLSRWANIVFGVLYSLIMLISLPGAWAFYMTFGAIEIALTMLIAITAWRWPRTSSGQQG